LTVGILNTIVGLGTIYVCKYFGQISDIPANTIGYIIGVTNSFFWNRNWTFSHEGRMLPAAMRFIAVFFVAYAANLSTALIAIGTFGVNSYLAHAISTVPYTVLFYVGSRYFAFPR
jgi:putative flippase GtrA